MCTSPPSLPRPLAGLVLALLLVVGRPAVAADPEPFPPARAAEDLPPSLRAGDGYRVRETGVSDAFLTTWEMETDYGLFLCPSSRLLEVRVREVAVMAKLAKTNPEDEVLQGLQSGLVAIPTSVVRILEDPLAVGEGVVSGAKRTLGRIGDAFGKRKATSYEEGGPDALLFAAEKRKVAAELGVDVYSTNSKLQTMLLGIAKARRAGGFGVDLAKSAVPGGAGTALSGLSFTADMTSLLRDRTPAELDRVADEKMAAAGVMPSLRRAFLANRALSPRHRTTISDALSRLQGVVNAGALVEAANETRTEAQALLHEQQALYLADRHAGPDPIASLDASGGLVAAFTRTGAMLVPLPIDAIALVPEVDVAAEALLAMPPAGAATSRTLLVTGKVTPAARAHLEARGFVVRTGPLRTGDASGTTPR